MKFFSKKTKTTQASQNDEKLSDDLLYSQEIIDNLRQSAAHKQISNTINKVLTEEKSKAPRQEIKNSK